ncbi:MAG TPA: AbrB family transcriptional regulator [Ramlibacter sp.]|nr:AbrB family transcriptional regulator [Ramlibacter sp.]
MSSPAPVRTAGTLLLALAAALLFAWLRVPLPWMLGPLLAVATASLMGAPTHSWGPLPHAGQWTIGAALGLYFTPQVAALVLQLWWAILLAIAWALLLGAGAGRFLHRVLRDRMPGTDAQRRATSFYAGAIGGASEMTLLAERQGARTDLVAAAHSLRLLMVALVLPLAITASGLRGIDPGLPGARTVVPAGLLGLAIATGIGAWAMGRTGRANPWFLGPFLVSVGLAVAGLELSAIPQPMVNAAQLVIGVSLGVRFRAEFLHTAPLWLAAVAAGTLGMIVLSAGFAAALAWATGLPAVTLVLGTSPGGIAEMAITAKVLQLGVPVVTAFQVCRLVAVLVLVEPLHRRGWLT